MTNPSFEAGVTGWTVGHDLPADPNDSSTKVDASVTPTTSRASDGTQALELYLEGIADDGTIWVQQPVDLTNAQTLAVDFYSDQSSFNLVAQVATYTGSSATASLSEADFNTNRQTKDHAGWKTYEYPITDTGTGLIAVGINVVWETDVTRLLDHVQLLERPPNTPTTHS